MAALIKNLATKIPVVADAIKVKNAVEGKIQSTKAYKELKETVYTHFDASGIYGKRFTLGLALTTYFIIFYSTYKIVNSNNTRTKKAKIELKNEIALQALARSGVLKS